MLRTAAKKKKKWLEKITVDSSKRAVTRNGRRQKKIAPRCFFGVNVFLTCGKRRQPWRVTLDAKKISDFFWRRPLRVTAGLDESTVIIFVICFRNCSLICSLGARIWFTSPGRVTNNEKQNFPAGFPNVVTGDQLLNQFSEFDITRSRSGACASKNGNN